MNNLIIICLNNILYINIKYYSLTKISCPTLLVVPHKLFSTLHFGNIETPKVYLDLNP